MNLIGGLSNELLEGLSNGMIYKAKIFCFETVLVNSIACALRWGVVTPLTRHRVSSEG